MQGPGENAGVVDIGDGIGIAFKMESHNHPSAVEPFQGAATGVGGILRDVFTMGARPIAFLNSLRFGSLDDAHTRHLFSNVVAGIGFYGNCVGIPTVGGEAIFDPSYQHNPLVNAMCVGVLPADQIMRGAATGVGNPVFVVGARTGRDGIHGATFASAEDPNAKERSAVQVGDPFLGKLLMEACLELIASGHVVGIQDMGAAGLTSSSAEMASRAGGGIELELDKVPVRETEMTPYEMMLSESQERMLVVMERGKEHVAFEILQKWGLQVAEIGRVTADGRLRLRFNGEWVADVPVSLLVDEAPRYHRPTAPESRRPGLSVPLPEQPASLEEAVLTMLMQPSVADKRWIYQQYDTSVRTSTRVGPGSDAAVVFVPGSNRAVAMCTDGNGRYVYLNPERGGAIAVAEAARNIVCSGGKPLAMTDCLNFGNPEKPEVMADFRDALAGMSAACRALDTPIVSGNVSLYNESMGQDIFPTPVVGAVGVIDNPKHVTASSFRRAGSVVLLLGPQDTALDGSLYWQVAAGKPAGDAPSFDIETERRVQHVALQAIREGLILAAHDVSEGGLAVTLAELAIGRGIGAELHTVGISAEQRQGWLFSEGQSRIVFEVSPDNVERVRELAEAEQISVSVLGTTGGDHLRISDGEVDGAVWLDLPLTALKHAYETAIPAKMNGQIQVTAGTEVNV